MSRIRIATRGSDLARAQANWVAERFGERFGVDAELKVIQTTGDRILDQPLAKIGGKGLFVKEIEAALLEGEADVAVHSAKDLPAHVPPPLRLVAFPERVDPRDALVVREPGQSLAELPRGAKVGTGSVRRTALLRAFRPDLEIVAMRGNVPTRLRKLDEERLDAVVLACAGLERLGMADRIGERIDTETMLPAVCQGALALEVREGSEWADRVAELDDPETAITVSAERAFLAALEGDCSVPLAALCEISVENEATLRGLVSTPEGDRVIRAERKLEAAVVDAAKAGAELAEEILGEGGAEVLAALRTEGAT
ncbi:MAG: hydroxymethylbilane synthase [Myxococcota bacterium]|nr:hydroxymethylbilane synthase [Myxococcota bacterium]